MEHYKIFSVREAMLLRVAWYNSLGVKLFALMSIALMLTVFGISWYNMMLFKESLDKQVVEETIGLSDRALNAAEGNIENWESLITLALQDAYAGDAQGAQRSAFSFVTSNPEALSLHIIKADRNKALSEVAFAFTGRRTDNRYLDKSISTVTDKIRGSALTSMKDFLDKQNFESSIENLGPVLGLPVLRIRVSGETEKQERLVGIATVWMTRFISALPRGNNIQSYLVDASGSVLAAENLHATVNKYDLRHLKIVSLVINERSRSGSAKYMRAVDLPVTGAFARSAARGISVAVERDARSAYHEIKLRIVKTALISFMILLGAVMVSYVAARSLTANIRTVTEATLQIAQGHFDIELHPNSRDELAILSLAVNHMSSQIRRLMSTKAESVRLEKEIETARTVQETLLPRTSLAVGDLRVSGVYDPASACGGDWWGYFQGDDETVCLCVADATGHGASAALITAVMYSFVKTVAAIDRSEVATRFSPNVLLQRLNRILWDTGTGQITMTFFASFINIRTGEMIYANAGHNFPMLIPVDAADPRLLHAKSRPNKRIARLIALTGGGSPLGVSEDETFVEKRLQLAAGDKIFLYTDGLIECTDLGGIPWGKRHMVNRACDLLEHAAQTFCEQMLAAARDHFGAHPRADDMTVVVAELLKTWNPSVTKSTTVALPAAAAYRVEPWPAAVPDRGDSKPASTLTPDPQFGAQPTVLHAPGSVAKLEILKTMSNLPPAPLSPHFVAAHYVPPAPGVMRRRSAVPGPASVSELAQGSAASKANEEPKDIALATATAASAPRSEDTAPLGQVLSQANEVTDDDLVISLDDLFDMGDLDDQSKAS